MYINAQIVDELIGVLAENGVKELIDAYIISTQDIVVHLKKAYEENDIENMRFYGHRLKGSSSTLGFSVMQTLGKDIETFAKAQDTSSAKAKIEKVEDEFARTIEELKTGYLGLFQ